jgi:hypothetical protein
MARRPVRRLFLRLDLFGSGAAFPEPILEPPGHGLHVAHTTRSRRASAFGLECPIVLPHLAIGITAGAAALFLNVVGDFATPATGRVTLIFPFSERGRSFRLLIDRMMLDNGGTHIKEQNIQWFVQRRLSIDRRRRIFRPNLFQLICLGHHPTERHVASKCAYHGEGSMLCKAGDGATGTTMADVAGTILLFFFSSRQ